MRILIIRHAIAEDRIAFTSSGRDDGLRPLTAKGIERMQQAASGLKHIQPSLHLLAHSPLTRALQTADILAEHYPDTPRLELEALAPSPTPERVITQLPPLPNDATIALVGHEPDLSELIGWLTTARGESFVELKKGAACLLEILGPPVAGSARLLWCLAPRQLRQLNN
jgi:phosphohistidine phosphatase